MARAVDRRSRCPKFEALSNFFQDDEIAPDQRRRLLGNIAGNARRLSALVARLLELARADVALHKPGLSVDVRPPMASPDGSVEHVGEVSVTSQVVKLGFQDALRWGPLCRVKGQRSA